ncbi:LysR family transcriptional regulator [Pseudomonas sp. MWU12-3103b]|uniref:LysR family transcriptional regulator n=1 Tax=Pseudomonas sp. MWU12-3103b TaxID=2928857 RepID=UPI001FFFF4ED|nr:LysR family transcriptional regulator [Pseudomonas sp. MWU12-3103b]
MNRSELRKADINLFVIFEVLMKERNVTRAANKLFLGQPAVSSSLNRLRILFNDPLLVSIGRRMEPTARAHEILQNLVPALDAMSNALSSSNDFDPASSTKTFRVGISDDVEFGLLPDVLCMLRREAPNVVIVIRHANHTLINELLTQGDITLGISQTKELPANAKRKLLRKIRHRVLRADNTNTLLTLDEYCSRPHILVSPNGDIVGHADEWLNSIGRKRNVVLSIPQFSVLPALLANTEMLAGLPDYAAKPMVASGLLFDEPMPFATPELELSMVWRSVDDTDPAERWLRNRVESMMSDRMVPAA